MVSSISASAYTPTPGAERWETLARHVLHKHLMERLGRPPERWEKWSLLALFGHLWVHRHPQPEGA